MGHQGVTCMESFQDTAQLRFHTTEHSNIKKGDEFIDCLGYCQLPIACSLWTCGRVRSQRASSCVTFISEIRNGDFGTGTRNNFTLKNKCY